MASIWRLNDQNFWVTSQNYKRSNYSALHRFDVKTINNVEIRRKTFKTTQNYESDQIIVHCIDFTSKQSKMLRYVAKHSKQRKPTKVHQIIMHCIDLTSKRSKLLSYVAKLQNDQIIVHWIDLTSKRFKTFELRPKTTKVIKLQK